LIFSILIAVAIFFVFNYRANIHRVFDIPTILLHLFFK